MTTKKKKRLRKDFFLQLSKAIFVMSLLCYLGSSVFLRSYNVRLNLEKQRIMDEIASISQSNEVAQKEVNQLSTYDRIYAIASADGMSLATNVVSVDSHE